MAMHINLLILMQLPLQTSPLYYRWCGDIVYTIVYYTDIVIGDPFSNSTTCRTLTAILTAN
jgi:hypothetical protein